MPLIVIGVEKKCLHNTGVATKFEECQTEDKINKVLKKTLFYFFAEKKEFLISGNFYSQK